MSLHIAVLQHIITECANLWLHDLDRIYRYHLLVLVLVYHLPLAWNRCGYLVFVKFKPLLAQAVVYCGGSFG